MFNPKLPRSRTATMQLILGLVTRGYRYHTAGTVKFARAQVLADKFASHYGVGQTVQQRATAKKRGEANAHLVLFPDMDRREFSWWLLATSGTGLVHDREQLQDAHDKRSRVRFGPYELVLRQRPGKTGGGTAWTWRRMKEDMRNWADLIEQEVRRSHPAAIQSSLQALARAPGFAGIREQTKLLFTICQTLSRYRGLIYPELPYLRKITIYDQPPVTLSRYVDAELSTLA